MSGVSRHKLRVPIRGSGLFSGQFQLCFQTSDLNFIFGHPNPIARCWPIDKWNIGKKYISIHPSDHAPYHGWKLGDNHLEGGWICNKAGFHVFFHPSKFLYQIPDQWYHSCYENWDECFFLLSLPQLNLNSTQKLGLTWKWLYSTTTTHPPPQTHCQQFWPNFIGSFLGSTTTTSTKTNNRTTTATITTTTKQPKTRTWTTTKINFIGMWRNWN